jgi:hypothetical protein
MNNFKKYTKAELINKLESKISNLNNKQNNLFLIKFKNYFSQLWNLILTFKNILVKLTLISFFIQIFKRYNIFKRLWLILNTIVLSIFGISLIDNFGFEFINNLLIEIRTIFTNIIDYLSNTKFYNYLNKLFSNNEIETPSSKNSMISINETISREATRNEDNFRKSEGNSKISEWLKPEVKEEIKENETSYKKYFIITGIIISASLIWYYSDEIKTGTTALIDWIISFRGDSSNNEGGDSDNSTRPTGSNIQKLKSGGWISSSKEINIQNPDSPIEMIDQTNVSSYSDKGKMKVLTSPSLENLSSEVQNTWNESKPASPSSNSSTETITQQTFASSSSSPEESFLIKDNWKNYVKSDIRESINYIESHLPKNEFDETTVINNMMNEVDQFNRSYCKEASHNTANYSVKELKLRKDIGEQTLNWINKMRKEIDKFD